LNKTFFYKAWLDQHETTFSSSATSSNFTPQVKQARN